MTDQHANQAESRKPVDLTLNAEVHRICVLEEGYPDKWPRHNACPCCGTGLLEDLFAKQGFSHAQCRDCAFVCVNPYPPEIVIDKLYRGAYYTNTRELFEYPRLKNKTGATPYTAPPELIFGMIKRATAGRTRGSWLDVGGGLGATAALVRELHQEWDVALDERNPRSLELARDLFPDLEVLEVMPDELARLGRTFDVISAVSVLEHIPQPVDFIRSYAALLRPGGTLALLVPQYTRLNATISWGASPNVAPPFHTSLFQEANLERALARTNMFSQIEFTQAGSAAFSLIHYYSSVQEYWDISIPTQDDPTPRSIMLRPYPAAMNEGLNALAEADKKLADHFAETDGRQYVAAYAIRSSNLR